MEDEEDHPQRSQKWLENVSKGIVSHEIEALTLQGLQIELAQKGLIRCKFVVPEHLSDRDGNWHVGAIAVLVDDVGAAAIFSYVGHIKASVGFNVSYLSTAKIQEEVEIEGKVIGHKDKLSLVEVSVKKKDSGQIIAIGKQWMSAMTSKL
ncbi:hypothetical protein Acr_16g0007970 [Actinidia rufa]|uniref:Acyl-coenzyme A thioesterase 13 n=1 Tax=Actinidia rufa TaxID=165716 RepID=A0A7J0FZR0_9ERIC|nr:hypothetical protein Acr_16g0007970 [Actinidia rufa]